jgi:hypothetical protein
MDDGSPDRSGFYFYTNSFTQVEVQLLADALKTKFDLNCSLHTRNDKFWNLIEPYVIPHFTYKLTLRGSWK